MRYKDISVHLGALRSVRDFIAAVPVSEFQQGIHDGKGIPEKSTLLKYVLELSDLFENLEIKSL